MSFLRRLLQVAVKLSLSSGCFCLNLSTSSRAASYNYSGPAHRPTYSRFPSAGGDLLICVRVVSAGLSKTKSRLRESMGRGDSSALPSPSLVTTFIYGSAMLPP